MTFCDAHTHACIIKRICGPAAARRRLSSGCFREEQLFGPGWRARKTTTTTAAWCWARAAVALGFRPRTEPHGRFGVLGDQQVIKMLARVPYVSHGALRTVSRHLNRLVSSPAFRQQRTEPGYTESGILFAGNENGSDCFVLAGGLALPIAPLSEATTWWSSTSCSTTVVRDKPRSIIHQDINGDSANAYDPEAKTWRSLPMNNIEAHGYFRPCHSVFGDTVIIIGHGDLRKKLTTFETYVAEAFAPSSGWTALPDCPNYADNATACTLNGRLCVAGGYCCDALRVWDRNEWTTKTHLPDERHGVASIVHNGKVMVIGGEVRRDPFEQPWDSDIEIESDDMPGPEFDTTESVLI